MDTALLTLYQPAVIFETSVGLSRDISLLLSGFNGVAYFLSSLIPIWILDRVGRRKLMLFAVIGQASCMAVLAGTTSVSHKATGIVAATMLFLFNFFFAIGLLAIPWLLPSEYSPTPIRSTSAALGSASNWIVSGARRLDSGQLTYNSTVHLLGRRDYPDIDQEHRIQDLRLLCGLQRVLYPVDLLFLS
jgi:MFS family permease